MIIDIHHVGSTIVEGLSAKPIIANTTFGDIVEKYIQITQE